LADLLNLMWRVAKWLALDGTSLLQASCTFSKNPGMFVQKDSNLNLGLNLGVFREDSNNEQWSDVEEDSG
jgi:hypothetical protein